MIIMAVALAAIGCKKDYTCDCTNGHDDIIHLPITNMSKIKAENTCSEMVQMYSPAYKSCELK